MGVIPVVANQMNSMDETIDSILPKMTISRLERELAECKAQLEASINRPVEYFRHNGKGPIYAVYGTSSISFVELCLKENQSLAAQVLQMREACIKLIADDALACSFQTLGQYRAALIKTLRSSAEVAGTNDPNLN